MGQNTPGMKTRCKRTRIRFHTARIHERENVVSTCRKQVRAGVVAQTFLSAGSRDFPVPCEPGDRNVAQSRDAGQECLLYLANTDSAPACFIKPRSRRRR